MKRLGDWIMNKAQTIQTGAEDDSIDALLGTVGADRVRGLYEGQIADLAAVLSRLRDAPTIATDHAEASTMLHMVAGTAGYFGDSMLGDGASAAERALEFAQEPAQIVALCDRVLRLIEVR